MILLSMCGSCKVWAAAHLLQCRQTLSTALLGSQVSWRKSWANKMATSSLATGALQPGLVLGTVRLCAEHVEVGYISHPAVTDSSMHLSVFWGGSDGRTRVPGKLNISQS